MDVVRYQETIRHVKNVCVNLKKTTTNTEIHDALETLKDLFLEYLDAVKESVNFPYYINKSKNQDPRFLLYYGLAKNIAKGDFTLPSVVHETHFDFSQFGCPHSSKDAYFESWLIFIRAVVKVLTMNNPEFTADDWIGSSIVEDHDISSVGSTETQKSPTPEQVHSSPLATVRYDINQTFDPFYESPPRTLPPRNLTPLFNEYRNPSPLKLPPSPLKQLDIAKFEFDDWPYPKKLQPLIDSLKNMHAYGYKLQTEGEQKGEVAMKLAIDLYRDAQHYFESENEAQTRNKARFVQLFQKKLHSEDEIMSVHRKYWKVIVANVLAALTPIGLLAISISLFATGQLLFNTPRSMQNVDAVDYEFDNLSLVNN